MSVKAKASVDRGLVVRKTRPRGIFCLECDWWGTIKRQSSVEPILQLLSQWDRYYVPYIHRNIPNRSALEHYLDKWVQRGYRDFAILYLAVHGVDGDIFLGDGRRSESRIEFAWLEDRLRDRCRGRLIHLAGCESLKIHGNRLNSFLRNTGALAVCGYSGWVDWLRSAAFDLLVMASMQDNALSVAGANAMKRRISTENAALSNELGFRMLVRHAGS